MIRYSTKLDIQIRLLRYALQRTYSFIQCQYLMAFNQSVFLEHFAYFCKCQDLMSRFRRHLPKLCMIYDFILNFVWGNCIKFLFDLDQVWLSQNGLERYILAVYFFLFLFIFYIFIFLSTLFNGSTFSQLIKNKNQS